MSLFASRFTKPKFSTQLAPGVSWPSISLAPAGADTTTRLANLGYDRIPFKNEFDQVIQPNTAVIYIATEGSTKKVFKGRYLGCTMIKGRVSTTIVNCDGGGRVSLRSHRIYPTY